MTFVPAVNGSAVSAEPFHLKRLSDVKAEPIRWLSPGRVPYGALTIIAGRPGEGKSQLTLNLAARVSHEAGALLIGNEDGAADVIVPRLNAHRANLDNVRIVDEEDPVFPSDAERLEYAIREADASLVVIDPFNAHLDPELSGFNDQMVRQASRPLAAVARRSGAAIVIVSHLRKSREGGPLDWIGGSGLQGAARSVLLFGKVKGGDPWDDDQRWLFHAKCNGAKLAPPLRCRVETRWVDAGERKIETSWVTADEEDHRKHPEDLA